MGSSIFWLYSSCEGWARRYIHQHASPSRSHLKVCPICPSSFLLAWRATQTCSTGALSVLLAHQHSFQKFTSSWMSYWGFLVWMCIPLLPYEHPSLIQPIADASPCIVSLSRSSSHGKTLPLPSLSWGSSSQWSSGKPCKSEVCTDSCGLMPRSFTGEWSFYCWGWSPICWHARDRSVCWSIGSPHLLTSSCLHGTIQGCPYQLCTSSSHCRPLKSLPLLLETSSKDSWSSLWRIRIPSD
jgi:hypothetical protein